MPENSPPPRRFVIDPESRGKTAWDIFISVLVVVSSINIPYRLVFHEPQFDLEYWILTFFFCANFGLNFLTAYRGKNALETDYRLIAGRYLKSWLVPDAIASLPIGPVILLFVGDTESAVLIAKVFLLFRLIYLVKLGNIFKTIEKAVSINPSIMRLISFVFLFAFVAHGLALGWIAIGAAASIEKDFGIIASLADPVPPIQRYVRALYFMTTTMATIGYGDITPHKDDIEELVYTIFVQIVGVGMYGYVIGNVSSMLANMDVAKAAFQRRMEEINAYMRSQRLPTALQKKVRDYYDYMWANHQSTGEESTLDRLPRSLALEVRLYLNREILEKVPFFKDADEVFIREIVNHLRAHIFVPGDFIVRKGEYGDCMYFISSGHVDVYINETTVVATLQAGSHFGEMSLIEGGTRNASVVAKEYCDVYELSKASFDRLRTLYTAFDEKVKEVVAERERANKAKES
jgi:hypothetical protein